MQSSVAMALTGIDGHFVSCNEAFSFLTGYSRYLQMTLSMILKRPCNGYFICWLNANRYEVEAASLFDLTLPEEMTQMFQVVSSMLSQQRSTRHFSQTCKFRDHKENCFVSMWLVRDTSGNPEYFQMMVVPVKDCAGLIGMSKYLFDVCFLFIRCVNVCTIVFGIATGEIPLEADQQLIDAQTQVMCTLNNIQGSKSIF